MAGKIGTYHANSGVIHERYHLLRIACHTRSGVTAIEGKITRCVRRCRSPDALQPEAEDTNLVSQSHSYKYYAYFTNRPTFILGLKIILFCQRQMR